MPLIIGCPKLDPRERFDKISMILENNSIRLINIFRMQIPCCSMLTGIINEKVKGKGIQVNEIVFSTKGVRI